MQVATVMSPLKIPWQWYGIKHGEKPCMKCTEMSLQWGAFRIMTLPKMSRCTFSKFLSNRSFPYLTLTPRGFLACWNMVSFDNSLLIRSERSGVGSCCVHHSSFSATNRAQYSLHSWRLANSTSWDKSLRNSPDGNCKLSYRKKVKLKSVMFSGDVGRPCGKYGTIIVGSTSLLADGPALCLSRAICDLGKSRSWLWLSRNNVWLLGKK